MKTLMLSLNNGMVDINIGKKYAIEKAKDQIWAGLGFVLQWAINGLKKK